MNDKEIKVSSSKTNIKEELTLLYLKTLDLSGKTPEEIVQLYYDANKRVKVEYQRLINENNSNCRR